MERLDLFDKIKDQIVVLFDVLKEATKIEQERFELMQKELETLKNKQIDDALTKAFEDN